MVKHFVMRYAQSSTYSKKMGWGKGEQGFADSRLWRKARDFSPCRVLIWSGSLVFDPNHPALTFNGRLLSLSNQTEET